MTDAAPAGTQPDVASADNDELRQKRALLFAAVAARRAHLLRVLDMAGQRERTLTKLAIATCERPPSLPGPGARAESADRLHGPEPGPKPKRAFDPGHCAETYYAQPTSTSPIRHPDDPDDPCASFSKVSSPAELHRSYARIKLIVSKNRCGVGAQRRRPEFSDGRRAGD